MFNLLINITKVRKMKLMKEMLADDTAKCAHRRSSCIHLYNK